MAEMWRLFIAIELPSDILAYLSQIQSHLKQQTPPNTVRWVEAQGIHLTLKFLGDVPKVQIPTIQDRLDQATRNLRPFELTTASLGCFPNVRRPRVVWVGIQGDILQQLQGLVEQQIAPLGYPTENRAFSPHLTLGRVRQETKTQDAAQLSALLSKITTNRQSWNVSCVSLMRSELKQTGAVYTELYQAILD
jgi:2'-5' RNA ligase